MEEVKRTLGELVKKINIIMSNHIHLILLQGSQLGGYGNLVPTKDCWSIKILYW